MTPNKDIISAANYSTQVGAQLDKEQAATVSKYTTSTRGVLSYDVRGDVAVVGGKKVFGPDMRDTKPTSFAKQFADDVVKNASPTLASKYVLDVDALKLLAEGLDSSFTQFESLALLERVFLNTSVISMSVAEDIRYVMPSLYDMGVDISSLTYSSTQDSQVQGWVNGALNSESALTRRYARMAKAVKNAVLAQTNNTNPFWDMAISEIYDRLTDYRVRVNRAITLWYNIQGWLAAGPLLQAGALALYPQYQSLYSSTFKVALAEAATRLMNALVGNYYDTQSLADYLDMATVGLGPVQNGGVKLIAPVLGTPLFSAHTPLNGAGFFAPSAYHTLNGSGMMDYTGGSVLVPLKYYTDETWEARQSSILQLINDTIAYFYSGDTAIIQTGLASMQLLPALGVCTYPGLMVKSKLVKMIGKSRQAITGATSVRYRPTIAGQGYSTATYDGIVLTELQPNLYWSNLKAETFAARPYCSIYNNNGRGIGIDYYGSTILNNSITRMVGYGKITIDHLSLDDSIGGVITGTYCEAGDAFLVPSLADINDSIAVESSLTTGTAPYNGKISFNTADTPDGAAACNDSDDLTETMNSICGYYFAPCLTPSYSTSTVGASFSGTRKLCCVLHGAGSVVCSQTSNWLTDLLKYTSISGTAYAACAPISQPGCQYLNEGICNIDNIGVLGTKSVATDTFNVNSAIYPCVAPINDAITLIVGSQTSTGTPIVMVLPNTFVDLSDPEALPPTPTIVIGGSVDLTGALEDYTYYSSWYCYQAYYNMRHVKQLQEIFLGFEPDNKFFSISSFNYGTLPTSYGDTPKDNFINYTWNINYNGQSRIVVNDSQIRYLNTVTLLAGN